MTCIVGVQDPITQRVWIGGDSAGVAGYSITRRGDVKVFRRGPYVLGFTSSFRMGQLLHHAAELPIPDPDLDPRDLEAFLVVPFIDAIRQTMKKGGFTRIENNEETGGCFLLGINGRLFQVESDWQVGHSLDGYMAVGCGDDLALGSLHTTSGLKPKQRVLKALEAAAHHSAGVSGPFKVVSA